MSEVQRHNGLDPDPEGAFVYYDEYKTLRDERDRLVKFAKSVGHPQWCKGFMTRDAELCSCGWYVIFPAALTPAGGGK